LEDVIEKAAEIAGDAPLTAKVLKEAREQVLEPEKTSSLNQNPSRLGRCNALGGSKSRSG
jgi:hypothetical protein